MWKQEGEFYVVTFPGGEPWPVFQGYSQSEELGNKFPDVILLPSNHLWELPTGQIQREARE